MTEIEQLIEQAEAIKENWHEPETKPVLTNRSWQEILDDTPCPALRIGKL